MELPPDLFRAAVSGSLSLGAAVGFSYLAGRATRKKSNGTAASLASAIPCHPSEPEPTLAELATRLDAELQTDRGPELASRLLHLRELEILLAASRESKEESAALLAAIQAISTGARRSQPALGAGSASPPNKEAVARG